MTRSLSIVDLPQDIHDAILAHVDAPTRLALALSCRTLHRAASRELASTVTLDGLGQLVRFLDRCTSPSNGPVYLAPCCAHGYPLPHSFGSVTDDDRPAKANPWPRSAMVRDLTLRSPGPLLHTYDSTLDDLVSTRPWLQRAPGGLIGAVLRLCPRLRSLHIIDSSLPLHHSLAQCIVTWTPQLQHLTVRSKHTDAASLAFIVRRLPQLRSLDVAGVQTCSCRGPDQADAAALALAVALGSSQITRLVLTSCRSFNDGAIFSYLARHQRRHPGGHNWDDDDDDDKNRIVLDSLELHRINLVRPQALVELLSSPACAQLRHLYIGGLRRLRSVHLSAFLERRDPARDLDLEVDARLMSRAMYCEDQCAASAGLTRLRLFGPSREQGVWIRVALREDAGSKLGRLREVIVIPREGDDGQMWKDYKVKGLDIRVGDDTSERVHQERRWCRQERARLVREQQQKLALIQVGGGAFAAYRNEDW